MDGLGSVVSDEPVGGKRRAVPRLVGAGGRRADGGHPILLVGSTFQRGEQEHAADAEEAPTLSARAHALSAAQPRQRRGFLPRCGWHTCGRAHRSARPQGEVPG